MVGAWYRFGEGQPPRDGEALVYVRQYIPSTLDTLLGDPGAEVVFAIYRYGMLHEQSGSTYGVPYGMLWTPLPPLP